MQNLIAKNEAAAMLRVNPRTITRWQNRETDPLPLAKEKPQHLYDPGAVFEWGVNQRIAKLNVSESGEVYDYVVERARLTHEQADKIELENTQLRGELIPANMVSATWASMVFSARAKLLALPTRVAPAVQACETLPEIQSVLKDAVYDALNELAGDGIPAETRALIEAGEREVKTRATNGA